MIHHMIIGGFCGQLLASVFLYYAFDIQIGKLDPTYLKLIAPSLGMLLGWWYARRVDRKNEEQSPE